MDNTILVHEFCHGITIRRVGGGTSRCMNAAISRGLGEGWADAMAEYVGFYFFNDTVPTQRDTSSWTEQTTRNTQDFAPGTYVLPNEMNGIRRYPYSTNA
jgi:extracellular elastinolytic metalloproteinase